jgi:hypothetical protein
MAGEMQERVQSEHQIRTRFQPGKSGNPLGCIKSKRSIELFTAIASEFGGELSAMEREYVSRAAEQLRRAERSKDNNEHVRLTRCADQLIGRVRDMRRDRKAASPVTTFGDLLKAAAHG